MVGSLGPHMRSRQWNSLCPSRLFTALLLAAPDPAPGRVSPPRTSAAAAAAAAVMSLTMPLLVIP